MRKNILSLSIATMIGSMGLAHAGVVSTVPASTGIPAQATALQLAAGGVGHALIVPYFTAQGGNATVLSLVNTDTNGKAVKVRFRGNGNSDDILDFQVFMSPGDHWSAVVSKNATTGIAELTTTDNTCTLPGFTKGVAQPFFTARLPGYATATEQANGTAEGYVEIFNMADIPSASGTTSLFNAIKHVGGVAPCTASVLATLGTDVNTAAAASSLGFTAPTTGLFGNWVIINVPNTTTFSDGMTAIRAVDATGKDGFGNFVYFPQSDTAASTTNTVVNVTADPLFYSSLAGISSAGVATSVVVADPATPGATIVVPSTVGTTVTAAYYDLPDMSTPYLAVNNTGTAAGPLAQAASLTGSLAVTSLSNEYSTDPTLTASTDWNFSMPTRRYSVAMKYGTSAATSIRAFSAVNGATPYFHSSNTSVVGDRICVTAGGQSFYDREETTKTTGAVFSPSTVSTFRFCGETSVTAFGAGPSVLGAANPEFTGSSAYQSGWGRIDTRNNGLGFPIMGSAFIKLNNPAASAGKAGTYGILSQHRFTK